MEDKKILDYLEFELHEGYKEVRITETLEYYLGDTYTKKEFGEFIKKIQSIYDEMIIEDMKRKEAIKILEEYKVTRDGVMFSDRFQSKGDAILHIEKAEEEGYYGIFKVLEMTQEDLDKYNN